VCSSASKRSENQLFASQCRKSQHGTEKVVLPSAEDGHGLKDAKSPRYFLSSGGKNQKPAFFRPLCGAICARSPNAS
jgi:hypothetical protein